MPRKYIERSSSRFYESSGEFPPSSGTETSGKTTLETLFSEKYRYVSSKP
jgi:hypothetical protein